jgi:hypothetical protein
MRLLAVACAAALGGCLYDTPARLVSLVPEEGGGFTFSAATSTVMTENDDGAAERIRRDWLAEALRAQAVCDAGYVIDRRRFVQPGEGPFGNGGDIVYDGRCLPPPR